jgi:hypothetical protein
MLSVKISKRGGEKRVKPLQFCLIGELYFRSAGILNYDTVVKNEYYRKKS